MTSGDLPEGTLCADRYLVEHAIASGGLSTVYRATDRRDGRAVALKVLHPSLAGDPEAVASFAREADHGWALRHPGFVNVLAQGWIDDRPFLALELLEGESLAAALRGRFAGGAPWPVARRILRRVGVAVAHAHARGLVHADLKPGNVFLLGNGDVRILDLGAVQLARGDSPRERDRSTGAADASGTALTPAYASPELLGGASARPCDDVFSLAVIGYELVSGRHPFDRRAADRARSLGLEPERPAGLPAHAWRTLRRGLDLSGRRRPSGMAVFVAGLYTCLPAAIAAAAAAVPLGWLATTLGKARAVAAARRGGSGPPG